MRRRPRGAEKKPDGIKIGILKVIARIIGSAALPSVKIVVDVLFRAFIGLVLQTPECQTPHLHQFRHP